MSTYDTGAQESDALYDDAEPLDDRVVTETIEFSDGSVLMGSDPFSPIDVSDVSDTSIERRDISVFRDA